MSNACFNLNSNLFALFNYTETLKVNLLGDLSFSLKRRFADYAAINTSSSQILAQHVFFFLFVSPAN